MMLQPTYCSIHGFYILLILKMLSVKVCEENWVLLWFLDSEQQIIMGFYNFCWHKGEYIYKKVQLLLFIYILYIFKVQEIWINKARKK